jgi:repressor LexA
METEMGDPKEKQTKILGFIREFIDKRDLSPTVREIQDGCGISSTSVVAYHLEALEEKGFIRCNREIARGIELLEPGGRRPRVAMVPIVGTIAAGEPIPTYGVDTDPDDTIEVAPEMLKNRENVFALRVKGNSMIDAKISDGDIVLMQSAETADDGEVVAAWLRREEETTLKKIYREGSRVRLQPRNPTMEPIYTDADNITIQAKFVATISQP